VQSGRRLPGAITHTSNKLTLCAGCHQRYLATIAHQFIAPGNQSAQFDLNPLNRGVDIACGAKTGNFFTEYMPRFNRPAQLQLQRQCSTLQPDAFEVEVSMLRLSLVC
jgi:hypothetical protein